jgi:hypothetical protein
MGDISSVRSAIAPVLKRVGPSELKGPDMAELAGKLAELPRSDFDALSRAMLRDTFTGANVKEDAFNLVDHLRAHGKLTQLDGALESISSRPAPLNLGDFNKGAWKTALADAQAALDAGGRISGPQLGALHEQLAAMPKNLFDKVTSKVTQNEYWAPSMRDAAFQFLQEVESQGKLKDLGSTISKFVD